MRFGFVTCVHLGLSCMEAIYEVGGQLELAITLTDTQAASKSGRVWIDEFCERHDLPLLKTRNINDAETVNAIRDAGIDWLFIIGWSQIARQVVLDAPRLGVLGMHPTLLPEGRGRAAIPWAILKQLKRTGVTLFRLDAGVDTGDILHQVEIILDTRITATDLYNTVDAAHVSLMKKAFPKLKSGEITPLPQDHSLATEWPGRKPQDGRIDLEASAHDAERLVRAVTSPYPGAFVDDGERRTIVWQARVTGADSITGCGPCWTFADGVLEAIVWEDGPSVAL